MSAPERDQDFPEVQTTPGAALFITAVSAVFYALIFIFVGRELQSDVWALYASLVLAVVLLVLAFIDLRTGLLLDILTLPLLGLGLIYNGLVGEGLMSALSGAVIGYMVIYGLAFFWRNMRGYEGIGLGDAKLLAAGGAWLGALALPLILLIASGLGILAALVVSQKTRTGGLRVALPFGPCLCFAIWSAWCGAPMLLAT